MTKILKLIACFILSLIVPQSKKILVFGDRAGKRFTDNSRYLFIYLNLFFKKYRCIWLSNDKKIIEYLRNKGFETYYSNSILGLYYGLRSSWHIFNYSEEDTSIYSGRFRKNLNLFHGTAIKYCDRNDIKSYDDNLIKKKNFDIANNLRIKIFKTFFVFANSDKSFIPWISWENNFPKNKCHKLIVSNLQRNIMVNNNRQLNLDLFRTDEEKIIFNQLKNLNKKIIGYFPTYRVGTKELFIDINDELKFEKLNSFLKDNNSIMVIKNHQNSFKDDKNKHYDPKFDITSQLSKYENFFIIGYNVDLTSILPVCDLIISDYSSCVIDFLFLDKAIILYTPDLESYSNSPGLALDIKNQNFAYAVSNFDGLVNLLKQYFKETSQFHNKHKSTRAELKNKIFEESDSFKNIIELISQY